MNETPTSRFNLRPRGPYLLGASVRFLEGFSPASYRPAADPGHLHLAFVADGGNGAVGVCLRQDVQGDHEDGPVSGDVWGSADPASVEAQVARILSIDVDGAGFTAIGERDPVVRRLQERYPGSRPVLFYSPYEAAAWVLIGHRIRIVQAARIKDRMTQEMGDEVFIHGQSTRAFPAPERLADLDSFPGLTAQKVERLRSLGMAAAEAHLDAPRLRAMPVEDALAALQALPGIGPFGSGLILARSVGLTDFVSLTEPRMLRAVALAYDLPSEPSPEQVLSMAQSWQPYRTWVAFLLRRFLEDETGEIAHGGRPR